MLKNLETYDNQGNLLSTESVDDGISASQYLANYRYDVEVGGINLGGVIIQTDRETRANLLGARTEALEDSSATTDWKTGQGFVTLDASTMIAVANAVKDHVKKCFSAERHVQGLIDGGTVSTVEAIKDAFDDFMAQ